jgi:hypothetical protein
MSERDGLGDGLIDGAPSAEPSRDLPGAIGSVLAIAIGAASVLAAGDYSPLGAVFPRAVGVLLIALGALYIFFVVTGRARAGEAPKGSTPRRAAVAAIMLGWGFALGPLGFLPSSAVAMALLMVVAHHGRWSPRTAGLYGGAAGVVLLALYGLFKHLLLVPLP